MKAKSSVYKGIEYIQISSLPLEQKNRILETVNSELLIKILADGKVIGNCLQFKDYEFWFDNVYQTQSPVLHKSPKTVESLEDSLVSLNLKKA
jgi:hypothetical protein